MVMQMAPLQQSMMPMHVVDAAQPIYGRAVKPAIKPPPYKSPPPYHGGIAFNGPFNGGGAPFNGGGAPFNGGGAPFNGGVPFNGGAPFNGCGTPFNGNAHSPNILPPAIKSVSFAESPVLLRRKVCFEDQVQTIPISPKRQTVQNVPAPPPRAEFTRLSHSHTSPTRLTDSISNPTPVFLQNLERVMKKKWQVAEKCKTDTTTTPHEVLGFRDVPRGQDASTHYYNTANVSHWIQENFGDQLYENMGNNMGVEPVFPAQGQIKKRPPPPPPKRAISTQLSTSNQRI